jgi:hypothetical protein
VSLHFPKPQRKGWTDRQRADELSGWMDVLARPDARQHVLQEILRGFGDTLLQQSAAEREAGKMSRDALMIERDILEAECRALSIERDALTKERDALGAARDTAQIKHEKILSSTSWRLTAPLRAAIDMVRRFKARQDA